MGINQCERTKMTSVDVYLLAPFESVKQSLPLKTLPSGLYSESYPKKSIVHVDKDGGGGGGIEDEKQKTNKEMIEYRQWMVQAACVDKSKSIISKYMPPSNKNFSMNSPVITPHTNAGYSVCKITNTLEWITGELNADESKEAMRRFFDEVIMKHLIMSKIMHDIISLTPTTPQMTDSFLQSNKPAIKDSVQKLTEITFYDIISVIKSHLNDKGIIYSIDRTSIKYAGEELKIIDTEHESIRDSYLIATKYFVYKSLHRSV